MNRTFSIDRFEADLAVLEAQDGALVRIVRRFLPAEAREGDVIALQNGAWVVLHEETERLRAELFAMQEDLFDE